MLLFKIFLTVKTHGFAVHAHNAFYVVGLQDFNRVIVKLLFFILLAFVIGLGASIRWWVLPSLKFTQFLNIVPE